MFTLIKPHTNFDFMGKRHFWAVTSIILVIASFVLIFTKGLNYGVDFRGGIEINVRFNDPKVSSAEIRSLMKEVEAGDVQVQQFGGDSKINEFLIRVEGSEANLNTITKDIQAKLESKYAKDTYEVRKIDIVGPKVGRELKMGGIYSLLYAMLGIFIYIAIRFDYRFAPGAVIATLHDIIITVAVFSLTGTQFTLSTVAAILTIAGYSVNDTVVIYDRIRETFTKQKGTPLDKVINTAVNETLSRTILTSVVTMLVVVMLLIFGGTTLWDFSLALAVGIVVGTYSSIFVASTVVLFTGNYMEKRKMAKSATAQK
jgi:preprotein translocase subunit SecF